LIHVNWFLTGNTDHAVEFGSAKSCLGILPLPGVVSHRQFDAVIIWRSRWDPLSAAMVVIACHEWQTSFRVTVFVRS